MNASVLARNILIIEQLKEILEIFNSSNIKVMPVKGAAFLCGQFNRIDSRTMEDIDVIIKKEDYQKAESALIKNGYRLQRTGEYTFVKTGAICAIDIHLDTTYLCAEDLWRTPIERIFEGLKFYSLPPENHLIYVICHSVIDHAAIRPDWFSDAKNIMEDNNFNWESFFEKTERAQMSTNTEVKLAAYLFLRKITALSEEILSRLSPTNIKEIIKVKIAELILHLPETDDAGHVMRLLFKRDAKSLIRGLKDIILPSVEFLRRRYGINSFAAAMLRPFFLSFKMAVLFKRILLGLIG